MYYYSVRKNTADAFFMPKIKEEFYAVSYK